MKQFLVLWRKEMLELWRSYKWLWVPLVFLGMGLMQPAATFYLPALLDTFGGLPEGAVIEIPTPAPGAVLAESLGQLGILGVLVLVLAAMGAVVGERNSGAAAMILVKPVSLGAYLAAKWAAFCLLILAAVLAGQVGSWYYTTVLFDAFPFGTLLASSLLFAGWLTFLMTVVIFVSVFLRSQAPVAFVTLTAAVGLALITPVFGNVMDWSPANLSTQANQLLVEGTVEGVLLSVIATTALIGGLLFFATVGLRRRLLAS